MHSQQFYQKTELLFDLSVEELTILMYLQENHLPGGFLSVKLQVRVYSWNIIKKELHRRVALVLVL